MSRERNVKSSDLTLSGLTWGDGGAVQILFVCFVLILVFMYPGHSRDTLGLLFPSSSVSSKIQPVLPLPQNHHLLCFLVLSPLWLTSKLWNRRWSASCTWILVHKSENFHASCFGEWKRRTNIGKLESETVLMVDIPSFMLSDCFWDGNLSALWLYIICSFLRLQWTSEFHEFLNCHPADIYLTTPHSSPDCILPFDHCTDLLRWHKTCRSLTYL